MRHFQLSTRENIFNAIALEEVSSSNSFVSWGKKERNRAFYYRSSIAFVNEKVNEESRGGESRDSALTF